MPTDFYQFNPVRDHDGAVSPYHQRFVDAEDFTVNPRLVQQLRLHTCPETTPEGRALWLYLRLCQVLKYDEGYYYNEHRHHPNDDPYASFQIVGDVTAETPVTCFNFSRIAVKLLNQIPGVQALMIAVGSDHGHFRFGYYTDQVAVDAEPSMAQNHFNDLARAKLGLNPQGLKVFAGRDLMQQLARKIFPPMLARQQQGLRPYLQIIQSELPVTAPTQIDVGRLVDALKRQGVDGATMVQLMFNMNHQFRQKPYECRRVGLMDAAYRDVQPQLLVRQGQETLRIDLDNLQVLPVTKEARQRFVAPVEFIEAADTPQYCQNLEREI